MGTRALRFETPNGPIEVTVTNCVVAGWTGRDKAAIDHHIEEMAEIGVPGPSTVPLYYRVAVEQLTQGDHIQVLGDDSSGEVEPVLVATESGLFLTVGSDHTDRKVEAYSIAVSKQMCPKVLGTAAWPVSLDDDLDALALQAVATIGGDDVIYQTGTLALIRPLKDLVAGVGGLAPGTVMLCGTVPVSGGIRPAQRLAVSITDPARDRTLSHAYDIETLPVVS
ncbi:MAG: DUF2848 domain-containing protein [Thalassobaculaceae bacterium]|nr:DUF2848 domain-containing protein [Thalassobaculaceae bacterium]